MVLSLRKVPPGMPLPAARLLATAGYTYAVLPVPSASYPTAVVQTVSTSPPGRSGHGENALHSFQGVHFLPGQRTAGGGGREGEAGELIIDDPGGEQAIAR